MFRLIDSFLFALERLWQHRALVFWALVGLAAATTLALSLPLYVDAVNSNLLESRLDNPPYAFRFRYLGSWKGNVTRADVEAASAAVNNTFTGNVQLPPALEVGYVRGGAWTLRLADNRPLGAFSIGALTGADHQIKITAGKWPPDPAGSGDPLPVLAPEKMLYGMGLQVGQNLSIAQPGGKTLKLKVTALWTPVNADDPNWIFRPKFFDEVLLVQPTDVWKVLDGIAKPVEESDWFVIFDGQSVKTADVGNLLNRIADGRREVEAALPGIRLDLSPIDGLTTFSQEVNQLTQQLIIMILPVGGLVLYFVSLVAGLLVSRQEQEDVTLRSRGMSRRAVLGIHFLMWLILAGAALAIGIALSPYVVRLVGQTTSFLRFDNTDAPLVVVYTPQALAAGAATALIAASSGLVLAWRTTRQTITSFKQQSARASTAWWQRMYLDVLLLIPAYYVLYTLGKQGGLVTKAEDPFGNPLAFVGPTLFALGNTLLFLRAWPFLMRIAARIVSAGRGISMLMALRELTRSIGRYRGGLLMMCFTLSLAGFTASMASTIDRSLEDSVNYRIGADAVLITAADTQTEESASTDASGQPNVDVTGYNTLPAVDLLSIDGIQQVSRVGRYDARLVLPSQRLEGTVLGVDRGSMAAVVRWRSDYASEPVADLFNRLAGNRTGILLDRKTAEKYKLRVGQEVTYQVFAFNDWRESKVPIVGLLDYFPTLDPTQKFIAVTNLDPIFEAVGTELPHDIWISLKPGTDVAKVQEAVREKGFPIVQWLDPQVELHKALTAPARRGVLGFLSVGFVATILLTLVGSIIQSAAAFKAQATQLGALRAMGAGGFTVGAYLLLSQGLGVLSGIFGGTFIGAATTLLYLPLLDFGGGLPPYLVRVAWRDIILVYAAFGGVLAVVTLYSTVLLGRERLSSMLKLGDSA
jgi:putative ABC transport system permease protein